MNDSPGSAPKKWSQPDEELIREAVQMIGDPQLRRAFFLELANPNWVVPLQRAGFFKSAPPPRVDDDGYVQLVPWAPSQYLARMAPEAAKAVSKAILEMDEQRNAAVERDIVEAASNMPASVSKDLIGKIVEYLDEPFRQILDPQALKRLLLQLLRQGQPIKASQLAEAMYAPRAIDPASVGVLWPEVIAGLDAHSYGQTLADVIPELTQALRLRALRMIARWLEAWLNLSEDGNPAVRIGPSFVWRSAIRERTGPSQHSIGDALIDATRDASLELINQGLSLADVLSILEIPQYPLMVRIAFHALSRTLDGAAHSETISLARARLLGPGRLNMELRHEYAELARSVIPYLTEGQFGDWRRLIASGPFMSDAELIGNIARVRRITPDEITEEDIVRWRRVWERDLLAAAREALPESGRTRLTELEAGYGTRDRPDLPMRVTAGWSGPQSPISRVEITAMDAGDMLNYLREWTPTGDQIFGPSLEGLGRELTEVVREKPTVFDGRIQAVTGLDPTYLRSIIGGWELALGDGQKLPWPFVIEVLRYVAEQQDDGDAPTPTPLSNDPGWRWSHQAIGTLLHKGLIADSDLAPDTDLRASVWMVIQTLASSPNPTVEYELQYGGDNMDPLTLSLNVVRAQALRVVVAYLSWLRTRNVVRLETSASEVAPEAYEVLEAHLNAEQDASVAVRSVYGESYGFLLFASSEWARSNVTKIFGVAGALDSVDDAHALLGNVAWSVFISTHGPNRSLFDALRDHYIGHVQNLGRDDVPHLHGARTPPAGLAEHIFFLYSQGVIGLNSDDRLVMSFFDVADIALRRESLSRLGWMLSHSGTELPNDVLERWRVFWEWREQVVENSESADELGAFSWWFMSEAFPEEWSISRLVNAVRSGAQLEMPGQVVEKFSVFAGNFPESALTILNSLTQREPSDWQTYSVIQNCPPILAAALSSSDVAIRESARRTLDRLGRLGHLHLKDKVDELLADH